MLFHSQTFILGFLPVVLAAYYALAPWRAPRQAMLVAASLVFYGWWDIRYVPLLVALTLANWLIVRGFAASGWRPLLAAGVALNLAVLGLFKYADFLGANAAALFGQDWTPLGIVLPLGISFFVFQKISYLVDLRRGDRHVYGFLDFCLFVTFFPQLIAGPLVRHNEIIHQFRADPRRPEMWDNLARGGLLFVIGLFKKLAVADTLAPNADRLFGLAAHGTALGAVEAWAAAASYTLQLYFDFSGYSDMAIGLALLFGLVLPDNFDAPYRATSIRDFWRRWHMTLSRFLRDYLYIPLGGNRHGPWRQASNVGITMLLGGLWHGAGWNFVLWGGLHGAALAANGAWHRTGLRLPAPLGRAATLLFVVLAWVVFRAPDLATSAGMFAAMAGGNGVGWVRLQDGLMLPLAALLAVAGPTSLVLARELLPLRARVAVPAGLALVYLLLLSGGRVGTAFIYFQF